MTSSELLELLKAKKYDEALQNLDSCTDLSDVEKLKIKAYIELQQNQKFSDEMYNELLSQPMIHLVLSRFYTTDLLSTLVIEIARRNDTKHKSMIDTILNILKKANPESYVITLNTLINENLLDSTTLCDLISKALSSISDADISSSEIVREGIQQLRMYQEVSCQ